MCVFKPSVVGVGGVGGGVGIVCGVWWCVLGGGGGGGVVGSQRCLFIILSTLFFTK